MALTAGKAKILMKRIEENQSWSSDNIQACHQSEEAPKELCALSTKMDVLLKWLDERANYKEDQKAIEYAYKDGTLTVNNSVPPQSRQRWNQQQSNYQGKYQGNNYNSPNTNSPPLRELIIEQSSINNDLSKKTIIHDEILKKINAKMDTFSSVIKEQLRFNENIELQIARLSPALLVSTNR